MDSSRQRLYLLLLLLWSTSIGATLGYDQQEQSSSRVRRGSKEVRDWQLLPEAGFDDDDEPHYRCGFQTPPLEERALLHATHENWKAVHRNRRRNLAAENITVPVAITVVVNSTVKSPVNGWMYDTLLAQALETLNYGFRDSPFKFQLLQVRHVLDLGYFNCDPAYENAFKTKNRVARKDVLNVYYCNTFGNDPTMLGYAQSPARMNTVPEEDGVVLINPGQFILSECFAFFVVVSHFSPSFHPFRSVGFEYKQPEGSTASTYKRKRALYRLASYIRR